MKKCSMIEHKENNAISLCQECKIYMCNKCENLHSGLFKNTKNHHQIKLDDNSNNIDLFSGLCENHFLELKYFCKTHNELCCSECIIKIKTKKIGKHSECDIYLIEEIENDKKNSLEQNLKQLEALSINIIKSIDKIKIAIEEIEKSKENLKNKVAKIFTEIRNKLNEREEELLFEIENQYNKLEINEETKKDCEKLSNKINKCFEKGKLINQNWKNYKLNTLISDCLEIENIIQKSTKINDNAKNYNSFNYLFDFIIDDSEDQLFEVIKKFGYFGKKEPKFSSKIKINEELIFQWLKKKNLFLNYYLEKVEMGQLQIAFIKNVTIKELR